MMISSPIAFVERDVRGNKKALASPEAKAQSTDPLRPRKCTVGSAGKAFTSAGY
jgi:hypothetical protein